MCGHVYLLVPMGQRYNSSGGTQWQFLQTYFSHFVLFSLAPLAGLNGVRGESLQELVNESALRIMGRGAKQCG